MIRPLTPADLPALIGAMREVHVQDAYPSVWPAAPEAFLAPPDTVGEWVAEVDGQVVGQVLLRLPPEPQSWLIEAGLTDTNLAIISRLFVAPRGRKQGLAEALFQTAWAEAERRDLRPVLDVHHKNHAAIRLYERLGWQRRATVNGNWTDPDGTVPRVHVYLPPR